MTPAEKVYTAFGGAMNVVRLSNLHRSEVYRWNEKHSRGRFGRVPDRYHALLLRTARENNIALSPADLVET